MSEKAKKVIILLGNESPDCGRHWEDPVLAAFKAIVKDDSAVFLANAVIWFDTEESRPVLSIYADDHCTEKYVDISSASLQTIPYSLTDEEIDELMKSL
jgi:hypothetical protein